MNMTIETVGDVLRAAAPVQIEAGWVAGHRLQGITGRRCMLGVIDVLPAPFGLRHEALLVLADYLRPRMGDGVEDTYNHDTAHQDSPASWVIAAFSNMVVPQVVGNDNPDECAAKAALIFEQAADAWEAKQGALVPA